VPSTRHRSGVLFAIIAGVCALAAAGYVAVAALSTGGDPPPAATLPRDAPAAAELAPVPATASPPRAVLVRAVDPKNPTLEGAIYRVGPRGGDRPRALRGPACLRFYAAGGRALCLTLARSGVDLRALILDRAMRVRHTIALEGSPSRARISANGRLGAMTTFVTGDSYTAPGQFSTRTTILDLASGHQIANLEQFVVRRDGRVVHDADFNFWGVTFARDDDTFFATLATGAHHYLVRGNVRARSAEILRDNVECPSLSPDGTRIAYKRRDGRPWRWRLHVLDLRDGADVAVSERRPIDDQVEWLDDRRLLYSDGHDVYAARADGGGRPRIFLPNAASPSTLR
jgi:hypothetical protein